MYSGPLEEIEYDPLLLTFMSTLGESLHTRSQIAVLEGLLRQVAVVVYKDNRTLPTDLKTTVSNGLTQTAIRTAAAKPIFAPAPTPPIPPSAPTIPAPVAPVTSAPTAIPGRGGRGRGRGRGTVPGP